MGEFLGGIAGLVNDCEDLRRSLNNLQRADLKAFEAFQRALEKTT